MTDDQLLSAAEVRIVQVMPSGLVITRLPAPVLETATKSPLPYVTEVQSLSAAEVRIVQVIPAGLTGVGTDGVTGAGTDGTLGAVGTGVGVGGAVTVPEG